MERETIIGFDLRINHESEFYQPLIHRDRPRYLLRPEVSQPRSVSTYAWPRAFPDLWWDTAELSFEAASGLPSDLTEMAALVETLDLASDSNLIAISIFLEESQVDHFGTAPHSPAESWSLLGYDVAERGSRLSALSSFDWGDDWPILRSRWSRLANDFNLFKDPAVAREYADVVEKRKSVHGPFWVFGLWETTW